MNQKILVSYASQGGATAGVAEAVGKALAESGAAVEVLPVDAVGDVRPYDAVVIGSAIHGGRWLPAAEAFLDRNGAALRQMPTAIFQVCMMLAAEKESYRRMVPEWLAPARARIQPVAEASFAGMLWPNRYPSLRDKWGLRIFLAFIHLRAGDYRDWQKIRAWAESISPALQRQAAR